MNPHHKDFIVNLQETGSPLPSKKQPKEFIKNLNPFEPSPTPGLIETKEEEIEKVVTR